MSALAQLADAVEAWFAYLDDDAEYGDAHLEGRLMEAMREELAKVRAEQSA